MLSGAILQKLSRVNWQSGSNKLQHKVVIQHNRLVIRVSNVVGKRAGYSYNPFIGFRAIRTSRETGADVGYNNIQHLAYLQYRLN